LSGCIETEISNVDKLNKSFISGTPLPELDLFDDYFLSDSDNNNLNLQKTLNYNDCLIFLEHNLDVTKIVWNSITIKNLKNETNKEIKLNQEDRNKYDTTLYCDGNKNLITLRLNKNNEKFKNSYKMYENYQDEIDENNFIIEAHNNFLLNREYLPREKVVAGREASFGYRSENKERNRKIDREYLYLNYIQVSKNLCKNILKTNLLNQTKAGHQTGLHTGSKWHSIILEKEELTIGNKYNFDNICLNSNNIRLVMYKPYDEDEEE
jgi:hypothetical protein